MDRIVVPSAQDLTGELAQWDQLHECLAASWIFRNDTPHEHLGW
ncbi:hypothetical protein GCM10022247_29740 [Allokutzneria multivorans]|uniref:Transposase n=1 Tax=Allokutzneria multivorans TaxID=1142134 RepID=A0ABP7S3A8_9PSEU